MPEATITLSDSQLLALLKLRYQEGVRDGGGYLATAATGDLDHNELCAYVEGLRPHVDWVWSGRSTLDAVRRAYTFAQQTGPLLGVRPEIAKEAGMDGDYARLLEMAARLDEAYQQELGKLGEGPRYVDIHESLPDEDPTPFVLVDGHPTNLHCSCPREDLPVHVSELWMWAVKSAPRPAIYTTGVAYVPGLVLRLVKA